MSQVRLCNEPKPSIPSWLLFPIFMESGFTYCFLGFSEIILKRFMYSNGIRCSIPQKKGARIGLQPNVLILNMLIFLKQHILHHRVIFKESRNLHYVLWELISYFSADSPRTSRRFHSCLRLLFMFNSLWCNCTF